VIQMSEVSKFLPTCQVSKLSIFQVEQQLRTQCLGETFYDGLIADLKDLSTAVHYASGTSYDTTDIVIYNQVYYSPKANGTTSEPSYSVEWNLADKFNTPLNNTLFCGFLGRFLAMWVVANNLPAINTQVTAKGSQKLNSANSNAASEAQVLRLQTWYSTQITEALENLDNYLTSNSSSFSGYSGGTCCNSSSSDRYVLLAKSNGEFGFELIKDCDTSTTCTCNKCLANSRKQTSHYIVA